MLENDEILTNDKNGVFEEFDRQQSMDESLQDSL